jgi:hypothetical protein
MKSVEQRRREQQNKNKADRERRKRAKAPIIVQVMIGEVTVSAPLMEVFSPIYERALPADRAAEQKEFVLRDTRLLDMAKQYDLPLTREQAFLVQEGDTFLPQFEKIQISDEEQFALIELGWNPLDSSNIAAVRMDGADLLILFHSGATYRYPNQAEMFYPFNEALSPGRLLHRTIRFAPGYAREA